MSLWKVITKTPVVKQEVRRGGFVWGRDGFTWIGDTTSSSSSPSPPSSPSISSVPASESSNFEEKEDIMKDDNMAHHQPTS